MKEKIVIIRLEKYKFKNQKNEDVEMCRVIYTLPLVPTENITGNTILQCDVKGSNYEKLKKYVLLPSVEGTFTKKYTEKGFNIKLSQLGVDKLDS